MFSGLASTNLQVQTVLVYGYLTYKAMVGALTIGNFTMYAAQAAYYVG